MNKCITIHKHYLDSYRIFVSGIDMVINQSDVDMLRSIGYKINAMSAVSATWRG